MWLGDQSTVGGLGITIRLGTTILLLGTTSFCFGEQLSLAQGVQLGVRMGG